MILNQHRAEAERWQATLPSAPRALAYLQRRGIAEESLQAWHIGYCDSDTSIMGRRITFPIIDLGGNVVSVAGRAIDGANPKYWHFPYRKERYLYGAHLIPAGCEFVVLCEGQVDAILIRQAGYPACAVMGSSLSPIAAATLRIWTERVVVYPDNIVPDAHAFNKALKWIPVLKSVGIEAVFPQRPYKDDQCSDPASIIWDDKQGKPNDPQWLHQQIKQAAVGFAMDDALDLF